MICIVLKTSQSSFVYRIQSKEKTLSQKEGMEDWKKRKKGFLTHLVTVIKKDPTMSIRKHANELKVHEETRFRPKP